MREAPDALRKEIAQALEVRGYGLSSRSGLTSLSERLARGEHRRSGGGSVFVISSKNTCRLLLPSSPHYSRVVAYVSGLMGRDPIQAGVILRAHHSGVWANGYAVQMGKYYLISPRTVVYLTDIFTANQVNGGTEELIGVVARVVVPSVGRVTELSVARMFNMVVAGPQTAKLVELGDLCYTMANLPNVHERGNYDEITLLRMRSLKA